jgi:myo-inositol-1(or 4)-monophosphatase
MSHYSDVLPRIHAALEAACAALLRFSSDLVAHKPRQASAREADATVDALLRRKLPRDGEGWLSAHGTGDAEKKRNRVWVVDALGGTQEFASGIPEFCISVALLDDELPVAGGICNPATQETFVGSLDTGVTYNGRPARTWSRTSLDGAVVLASRAEIRRGEWEAFRNAPFAVRPMGSVAYRLALVAAGRADATFTRTPKHVWEVAAGIALVTSAGGIVRALPGQSSLANHSSLLVSRFMACAPHVAAELSVITESEQTRRALAYSI